MYDFSIGVILESFKQPIPVALKKAREVGASGIQVYATYGEMAPENLNAQKKAEFLDMLRSEGLVISALCGDLGRGFADPEQNPELIDRSKRILDLAKELGTNIVTTHIGVVPGDPSEDRYKIMQEACFQLAQYADSLDAHFAIETGPEKASILRPFLDSLHSTGVAVNLDPANLVMVSCDDAVAAVHTLKDYIVHTHAKDGRHYASVDDVPVKPCQVAKRPWLELPLGEGDVPFPAYLKALDEIGYHGFLTIEREVGDTPEKDIRTAVDFLNRLIK